MVAFAPSRSDSHNGECDLYIRAKQDTLVRITNEQSTQSYNIYANTASHISFDYTYRQEDAGINQLGIYIEADANVTVLASNNRGDGLLQTILVLPLQNRVQDYMVISYPTMFNYICTPASSSSFFIVASLEDNTAVAISKYDAGLEIPLETVYLNGLQVYFNKTILSDEEKRRYDFTGYRITADKPVSVTAGNACADTNTDQDPGPIWASMPTVDHSGTRYISHTLNYIGVYDLTILRVLALMDDTQVSISDKDADVIQYRGQFVDYSVMSDNNSVIECDKPCRVAQYSFNDHFDNRDGSAVFMVVLPPVNYYTDEVTFNIPESESSYGMTDYMSIVYLTETPNTPGLYYDGVELMGWNVSEGQGFSTLETEITGDSQLLHTLNDASNSGFVALIHGQSEDARGYGYISGFNAK